MSVKNADPNGVYSHAIVLALEESIDELQKHITRYRGIIRYLRIANSELRRLKNIQLMNDAEFKSMCGEEIVVDMPSGDDGLSDPQAS